MKENSCNVKHNFNCPGFIESRVGEREKDKGRIRTTNE